MATDNPYDPYTADIYTGGSLADYRSSAPPYASGVSYSKPRSARSATEKSLDKLYPGTYDPTGFLEEFDVVGGAIKGMFGGSDRPKPPRWQRLANEEWAQGNAALSAYSQLYEPTLRMAQRSAADYGDLYRRAANDQLAFELRSTTTKRNADLADFQRLGGDYVQQLRSTNPLLAQYYDTAQSNLALGSQLSPQQQAELEQSVRQGQAARGMGLGPTDVYAEALAKTTYGENLRQNRMNEAQGALGLYGDIFQATTGRPTMSPAPAGANIMAPNSGIGIEDYLSQGINLDMQRRNANAADKAGKQALTGQIIGGLLSGAGGIAMCWVAREVFGADNPKWMLFREWMVNRAPEKLRELYVRNGAKLAEKLKELPQLKPAIRAFMEEKIGELQTA